MACMERFRQISADVAFGALIFLLPVGLAAAVELGAPAPAFELTGLNGVLRLGNYQGKVVYLDFWASWCGPCRQSFPWMNMLQEKYADQGLQVISVNLDARRPDADRFLAAVPANFVIAFDPAGVTPRQYGVKGMPTSVLIGRDGKVIAQTVGFKPSESAGLEQKIRDTLRNTP